MLVEVNLKSKRMKNDSCEMLMKVNPISIARRWWKRIPSLDDVMLVKVNLKFEKIMFIARYWWKSQVYHGHW
ncbi:hypothetical protein E6C27_scaffold270G001890 [Cucumis melo var. makuwa]|uniref:Uncharacterized protein n=1 Tax=Cucumis melo var. makuwa TaxID=1194695 RepID=A0A5A7TAD5_CUCMM|nr:hypothetical protein E6C27_scaffold270G001890 [Cucumis melo var. makuwa]